jgi:hypothetical protein
VTPAPRQPLLDYWSRRTGRLEASCASLDLSYDNRLVGTCRMMTYTRRISLLFRVYVMGCRCSSPPTPRKIPSWPDNMDPPALQPQHVPGWRKAAPTTLQPPSGGALLCYGWQSLRSCEAEPSPEVTAMLGHSLRSREANAYKSEPDP